MKRSLPALVLFLLLAMSELASCQPVQEDPNKPFRLKYNMVIVFVVVFPLFLLVAYLSFLYYALICSWVGERRATRSLDASMIETFPTFVYSEVKTQRIGNGALECVICLNKFGDDETLRLLPKCDHVFHSHCIGAWLQGHVTCPVCRTDLAGQQQPAEPEVITETDLESQQNVIPEPATGHSVVLNGEFNDRFTLRLPEDLKEKMVASRNVDQSVQQH